MAEVIIGGSGGSAIIGGGSAGGTSANPGGSSGQVQYNNASAFAGTAVYTDGTNLSYGAAPSGSPTPQLDLGSGNGLLVNSGKTGFFVLNQGARHVVFQQSGTRSGLNLSSNQAVCWSSHDPLTDPEASQDVFLNRGGAGFAYISSAGGASGSFSVQGNLGVGSSTGVTAGASNQVNGLLLSSAITGAIPSISAAGSDTNISLRLTPKGTGAVIITLASVPVYANNAAASAGGLAAGSIYRTGADPDTLAIVH